MLKVMDLFSGIGGLSLGFEQAGFEVVLANELDESIAEAYKFNHPKTEMINEDISQLDLENYLQEYIGVIDVVVGGPPCQGFSQKGARDLLGDDRNYLFRKFYEVVKIIRPKYVLIENVPNILTAQKGLFKEEIYSLFKGLGYGLDSSVLNAFDFGIPQIRKRAFIVGKYRGNVSLPLGNFSEPVCIEDAISDLAYLNSGEGKIKQEYLTPPSTKYQAVLRENSKTLYNHVSTKHSEVALKRMRMIPAGKGREVLPQEQLTKSIYSGTWARMIDKEPSVTITTRFDTPSSGRFTHYLLDRAITVREAARIQSFPDNIVFCGSKGSQMKQVGNAVPPLLAKEIANSIYHDYINESITK
ncbi:DNA-cytosine methyltransferase [Alkalibacillus flavidus]|uniref:Cytosine-specific methyltransferase n=1 Tax=Alkalibacillus flavidus TaxID=546021 RepID=A0ABV2KTL2_9BACI